MYDELDGEFDSYEIDLSRFAIKALFLMVCYTFLARARTIVNM